MERKYKILIIVVIILILGFIYLNIEKIIFRPTSSEIKLALSINDLNNLEIVVQDLEIPWEIVFLPSSDILVTERPGKLLIIGENLEEIEIDGVTQKAEGGLLGMALHPNFENNNFIYIYITDSKDGKITNRIERYKLISSALSDKKIILDNIPGAPYHDGGRIGFGPDELLYVTTGDATQEELAQDIDSLAGKILRLNDDGSIPEDNPFGNAVYSYGHRNPQGLAWDLDGNLWSTEHGRSGRLSGMDELNLIEKGKNYGWPAIQGDETNQGMEEPKVHSGPDDTWAPAGLAYYDGSLFFSGLRGETLYEAKIENGEVIELIAHFRKEFGRLRAVVIGPDDSLYISTSNTDGRGKERSGDDKIIKLPLEIFKTK